MALTKKRQVFIEEYLRCWNATQAAAKADYAHPGSQGHRLLKNVEIQAEITRRLEEKAMSANEVLTRLADMARADISDFVDEEGGVDWDRVREKGCLVKKVSHGRHSSIELHDAQTALQLLAKHHRLFTDWRGAFNIDVSRLTDEQLERIANGEDPLAVLATSGTSGTGETAAAGDS